MKTWPFSIIKLELLAIALLLCFSCNHDADKPPVDVIPDETNSKNIQSLIVNDAYVMTSDDSIEFNVLSNDKFTESDNVRITEVSTPTHGTVIIDKDTNVITYTPSSVIPPTGTPKTTETILDSFGYTVEVVDNDGHASIGVGTIKIAIVPASDSSIADLIFSSGFEGDVIMEPEYTTLPSHQFITGMDSETGFTWPPVLGGSTLNALKLIQDGDNLFNEIRTVVGHNGTNTKAMYNEKLVNTTDITQSPYQLNNWQFNPDKFYVRYWMKVNNGFIGKNNFRVIWETKTENYETGGGFRIAVLMNTDSNGKEIWEFRGDTKPGFDGVVWSALNNTIPFPKDEWFIVEFFVDFVKDGHGRAFFKVNGQTIGDLNEVTNANSENIQVMMLTQIYGSVDHLYQYIDDIEIWNDVPY